MHCSYFRRVRESSSSSLSPVEVSPQLFFYLCIEAFFIPVSSVEHLWASSLWRVSQQHYFNHIIYLLSEAVIVFRKKIFFRVDILPTRQGRKNNLKFCNFDWRTEDERIHVHWHWLYWLYLHKNSSLLLTSCIASLTGYSYTQHWTILKQF